MGPARLRSLQPNRMHEQMPMMASSSAIRAPVMETPVFITRLKIS
jgi:hypothetical protein